jgi:lysophospholipase L1-like esterase
MTRRLLIAAAAAAAAAAGVVAGASATHPPVRYYLALGDSLSQGVQPDVRDVSRDTDQGYADQLFAIERRRIPGLRLVKLGCGGETTSSMISGHSNGRNARAFHCRPAGGSQLGAAERFLRAHHRAGEVALVTIDIGANDVDGCATSSGINFTCVGNGVASIEANVPTIVRKLRKAAGRKAKIAGMTYYDPFLAQYLMGSSGQTIAAASVALAQKINGDLTTDFRSGNFKVADVARAFDTYTPFSDTTTYSGQTVPVAVANICQLTWMCAPAPRGPNVHANASGYREISTVFKKTVG